MGKDKFNGEATANAHKIWEEVLETESEEASANIGRYINLAQSLLEDKMERGDPAAYYVSAHRHFDGKGVDQDEDKGVAQMQIAAEKGLSEAQYFMSMRYLILLARKEHPLPRALLNFSVEWQKQGLPVFVEAATRTDISRNFKPPPRRLTPDK